MAVGWTVMQKWSVRLGTLAVFIVLSRLLGPEDIGLAALALAIVGVLILLVDVGTSVYIVQTPSLDRRQISTVFWTHLSLCCAVALGLVGLAGPVAALLDQPDLERVLQVLAVTLPLSGLVSTPAALLTRDLSMKPLAIREMASSGIASIVGLTAAVLGAGVWALVAQSVVQSLVGVIVIWSATTWRPSAEYSATTAWSVIRFGSAVSGTHFLSALHDRLEQFLLGALAGVDLLGYWAVGTRILNLIHDVTMAVLDTVALPVLARERQHPPRFRRALQSATAIGLAVLTPILTILAFATPVLVTLLFGTEWTPVIVPVQILCLAYTFGGLIWFSRPAFMAQGRSGVELSLTLLGLLLHAVAVVLAAPHGLVVLAWAVAADVCVMVVIRIWVQRVVMGVSWHIYGMSVRVLVAGAGMTAVMAIIEASAGNRHLVVLATQLIAGALTYIALMRVFNRTLLQEMIGDFRRLVRR